MAARPLSAQVILREGAQRKTVAEFFDSAGFAVGPIVATSFAITGPRDCFEAAFGAEGASLAGSNQPAELPLAGLPADVVATIEAVAVQGPPDFGPP